MRRGRVPHARAHAGAVGSALRARAASSARSRAPRRRAPAAARGGACYGEHGETRREDHIATPKRTLDKASATIIQSRLLSRAPRTPPRDSTAVKSPAESLNYRQSLLEFLEAGPGHEEALLEEFERKRGQGDPLYSSLLYLLTHLNFTERQAARHWKKIVSHRDTSACGDRTRSRAARGDSRLLRERQPRAAQPDGDRALDLRAHRALRGDRRAHGALQPRVLPAGVAAGGAALQAPRPARGAAAARPRQLQAGQRRARPRRGRPRADEGGGRGARGGARDRRGRPLRRRGVRRAAAGHVAARRVRGRRAHPPPDRGALRARALDRSRSRAASRSSPTTPGRPPT